MYAKLSFSTLCSPHRQHCYLWKNGACDFGVGCRL
nr:MAG TPA: zinc finger protein [Caudoviricetes sp.]